MRRWWTPPGWSRAATAVLGLALSAAGTGRAEGPPAAADDPFTLDEAFALALEHSPQLKLADEQVVQARLSRQKAFAVVQPQVSLGASYTLFDEAVALDFSDLAGGTAATGVLYASLIARGQLTDFECEAGAPLLLGDAGEGITTCSELLSALLALQEDFEAGTLDTSTTTAWIYPKHQVQFGLSANLPLTPRAPFLIRAAGHQVDAAEAQLRGARQDLFFGVYQAYLGAVKTEELVEIQQAALETAEAHLSTTRTRSDLGQIPGALVLRAEVEVLQARRELEKAGRARDDVRRALAMAIGVEHVEGPVTTPAELTVPVEDPEALIQRALAHRPDLLAVAAGTRAAESMKGEAIAQLLPQFNLAFQYGRQWGWAEDPASGGWVDAAGGLGGKTDQWTFAVQAQLPLWDGLTRITQVQEAGSRLRQARHQAELLRQLARKEVSDAAATLRSSAVALETARRQVDLASENMRLTEARYRLGQDNQLSVLDARLVMEQARLGLLSETLDRDLARATLLKAAGVFAAAVGR